MANIQERRNKEGKLISYSIRVYRGRALDGTQLKPHTTTYTVSPGISEKTARKRAESFAAVFERDCKEDESEDGRQRFDTYCDKYIILKRQDGTKRSTIERYEELTERIYKAIGHIRLCDLRVKHLRTFYANLKKEGVRKTYINATAKIDLAKCLKEKGLTRRKIAEDQGYPVSTIENAVKGQTVREEVAQAVSNSLGLNISDAFNVHPPTKTCLSQGTVIKYHRLISAVLSQAVEDKAIKQNVALGLVSSADEKMKANCLQKYEIKNLLNALEKEALKWRIIVVLFLLLAVRRGELLGLKWSDIDYSSKRLYIRREILYSRKTGMYEEAPKTPNAIRTIKLEQKGIDTLMEYKAWQESVKQRLGSYYKDKDFIFTRDNGDPIHPDSINNWLRKFAKRNNLPNLHPHLFRHTAASLLIFAGADIVSISKMLGHKHVSTTTDFYGHVIDEARDRNAAILANEIFDMKDDGD